MNLHLHRLPILVTGASSGIGAALARSLAAQGHPVYATARKDADLDALAQIDRVTPIRLDVRDAQQVRAARDQIIAAGTGLYGLVNNAGIGPLGPFSTWTDAELRDIFEVNVFGIHRVTRALLDLLLASQGRIVNIGSQGGMITKKYYGPYTMTKFALEAYTEALDDELAPHGVRVSVVQPGGVATEVGRNAMPATLAHFRRAAPPFAAEAQQMLDNFAAPPPPSDGPESEANRKPSPPEVVVAAVADALFAERPKLRYLVGTKWEGDRVIHALIEKLLDENDNPHHSYTRDELVALLDRHISERGG
jgi:NAD(P)-dependent dehydrogenase (short-subunit alcohol dehydrogenase family)